MQILKTAKGSWLRLSEYYPVGLNIPLDLYDSFREKIFREMELILEVIPEYESDQYASGTP